MNAFMKALLILPILCLHHAVAAAPRVEVSLNGDWFMQKVDDLSKPPQETWKPCRVPDYVSGTNYERAWFRRSFEARADWTGQRLKLRFNGVKFNSTILVNGRKVGGNLGGYEPFEVDITDAVKFGGTNELLVGVCDWTSVFSEKANLSAAKNWEQLRSTPQDRLLSPIGGLFTLYGIWDNVTLRVVPPVHVQEVFVKTSFRQKRLEAEITVANEDSASHEVVVKGRVFELGVPGKTVTAHTRPVIEMPAMKLALKAGETQAVTLAKAWPNPKLWSHLSPQLYELRVELAEPTYDACSTRFGFRELWAEKDAFYLNGTKINLLATSTWPQHRMVDRAEIEATYRAVKEAHCVAIRLHTQPWPELFYEVADELGLLIVVEGAVWCDQNYRFKDPRFWENYATHLRRTVEHLRNHPSVVMWSLENEILHCATFGPKSPVAKDGLADMGHRVKQWDPTRLITYEADLDPRGAADVLGLHYPWPEYPHVNQYPNCCYWMDGEIPMHRPLVDDERERWQWDRRKPLYIGEFMYAPPRNSDADTVFCGDQTYANLDGSHTLAKASAWRMQIEAYRWHGVSGICPWTMFEGPGGVLAREKNPLWAAVHDCFEPNAVFVKEYDSRFYAGDEVCRTLVAYNDTFAGGDFTVAWSLICGGKPTAQGRQHLRLGSAEHQVIAVRFRAPSVTEPADAQFKVTLRCEGRGVCFENTKSYRIHPRARLTVPAGCRLALYDPIGTTEACFTAKGLAFTKITSLAETPDSADVLIVGERVLKAATQPAGEHIVGQSNPDRERLDAFVRNGGRVLVLQQQEYPGNLLSASLSDYASTITFGQMATHLILRGVGADDLKFWRGDHGVSTNELLCPTSGGCRPIIVSGSGSGLSHAPLVELPRGKGTMVLCQLRLLEKAATEPVAQQLLQNTLDYLAAFAPDTRATCVISDAADFKQLLATLRLRSDDLTGKLASADLARYGLMIICGSGAEITAQQGKIRSWIEGGGSAIFQSLTPADMEKLNAIFPKSAALQSHRGHVRWLNRADPLTAACTWESLNWLGKHEDSSEERTPLADGVADYALVSRGLIGAGIQQLNASEMAYDKKNAQTDGQQLTFFTDGSATQDIRIPEDGRYGISVTAKGDPAAGLWPLMEVAVDGEVADVLSVPSRKWMTLTAPCELKRGAHTLKLSFINDFYAPPEDRNLHVKQVAVVRMPAGAEGFVALSRPAFLVKFDIGKGRAVVDEIAWPTESRNTRKALQYAQTLLTALGADFEDARGDLLGSDEMQEAKGAFSGQFSRAADHVTLASNGHVVVRAKFARGGRYTFELVARGTPLDNVYPLVDVLVDDAKVGTIELRSEEWRPYWLQTDVAEGRHEIKLVFTNDAYRPPQDRNLCLQKLLIRRR